MLKLVVRGIRANLGRLILTLISVFLGVAFVSGSFVLADSLRSIFNQISETAFAGVDAQVRAIEPEINSSGENLIRFDESLTDAVAALPGVEYAEGGIFAFEQTYSILDDGEVNRPTGAPPSMTVKLETGLGPPQEAVNTGGPAGRLTSPSSRIE